MGSPALPATAPAHAEPAPRAAHGKTAAAWPARTHPPPRRHQPYAVNPASIKVHDGDTFYVAWATIRVRGVDTPELGEPRAEAATRRLAALLAAGPVVLV